MKALLIIMILAVSLMSCTTEYEYTTRIAKPEYVGSSIKAMAEEGWTLQDKTLVEKPSKYGPKYIFYPYYSLTYKRKVR